MSAQSRIKWVCPCSLLQMVWCAHVCVWRTTRQRTTCQRPNETTRSRAEGAQVREESAKSLRYWALISLICAVTHVSCHMFVGIQESYTTLGHLCHEELTGCLQLIQHSQPGGRRLPTNTASAAISKPLCSSCPHRERAHTSFHCAPSHTIAYYSGSDLCRPPRANAIHLAMSAIENESSGDFS